MALWAARVHAGWVFVMSWGAEGIAQAASEFQEVDDAAEVLCASVRRAALYGASQAEGTAYGHAAEALAEGMRSEGRTALSAGRNWRRENGVVWVALFARGD